MSEVYGFGGRLSEAFPSQVIIDVTEVCNLACTHCAHPEFKKSEHYGARNLDVELNRKLIDEVRDHGQGSVQYLRYTGNGEPLLHPKFFPMLADAASRSGVTVTLTTNGTLLDEKRIATLLETGVHVIDISIDAFRDETYSQIRVKGKLPVTRENVRNLLRRARESSPGPKIVVSFIEQPQNKDEAQDFKKYWEDEGADYVVIRRLHSNSGASEGLAEKMREDAETLPRRPCLYPWERIVLTARGQLAFCPADWHHQATFVDYRDTTVREAWQGTFYQGLRRAHLENEYAKHKFCGQCPDWKCTRWPWEGRSYADMVRDFKATE